MTYTTRHDGHAFEEDNRRFYLTLKSVLQETEGYPWIEGYDNRQDGRAAWLALINHYDGPGEVTKRVAHARKLLQDTNYKGEKPNYNFETFTTKLQEAFTVIADNGNPHEHSQSRRVEILLEKILEIPQVPEELKRMKTVVRASPGLNSDFTSAVNQLSQTLALTTTASDTRPGWRGGKDWRSGGRRGISSFNQGRGRGRGRGGRGRGGRGRGRGRGRGGGDRGHGDQTMINGVDVTDPNRTFSPQEFRSLLDARYVTELKRRREGASAPREGTGNQAPQIAAMSAQMEQMRANIAALGGTPTSQAIVQFEAPTQAQTNAANANGGRFGRGAYHNAGRGPGG